MSSIAVLLSSVVFGSSQLYSYYRHHRRDLVGDAELVARICRDPLVAGDAAGAMHLLRSFEASPLVAEAIVYSEDGSVFARYSRWGSFTDVVLPPHLSGFRFDGNRLFAFAPVVEGDRFIGAVCVIDDLEEMSRIIIVALGWLLVAAALTSAVAVLLAWRFQEVVSGPVLRLARTIESIEETGDSTIRAVAEHNDEVGRLGASFNAMLDRLHERDEALRLTQFSVDHAAAAAYWMDADGRFFYVNETACSALGYTKEELLQMGVADIDPDFPASRWPEHWRELRASGSLTFESRHQTRDGKIFPIEVTANLVEFEGREVNCAYATDISERRTAEDALRASEEQYRQIFDAALVGLFRTRIKDGKILNLNESGAKIAGYRNSAEAIADGAIIERFYVDRSDRARFLKAVREGGAVAEREVHLIAPGDGRDIFVEVSARIFPEQGHIEGAVIDITSRKKAEQALVEAEERYRSLFENAVMGIVRTTPDGRILLANPAVLRMLGYESVDELAAERNVARDGYVHTEDRTRFREIIERDGMIAGFETAWPKKDGSPLYVSESARVVRDGKGNVLYYDGTVEDISERKRAEQEAQERMKFLHCLSEVSQELIESDPFIALPSILQSLGESAGASRTYLFENHEDGTGELACSIRAEWISPALGSEVERGPVANLPYVARGLQRWVDEMANGRIIAGVVSEFPDGERIRLEEAGILSIVLIPMMLGGTWFGYIGFEDCRHPRRWQKTEIDLLTVATAEISAAIENKQLLDQLRQHAEALEIRVVERTAELAAVNAELEAFAYSVSHDLRAPLRAVNGFSQALLEDSFEQLSQSGRDYLKRVRDASQRMGDLIDDLLRLSRLSRAELEREQVDISGMAERVLDDLRQQDPDRNVEIVIAPGIVVDGDPRLLRIVVENLLNNAWKFTRDRKRPKIEIGTIKNDGWREVFVKDNGVGFDNTYADKLFGAFQRLHSVEDYPGSGIGLATVQRIIHRHGGTVRADGILGEGATFFFALR